MVRTIPLRPGMRIPFRNLLHDHSSGGLIVKHGAENDYLHLDITNDAVLLHRESFVRDVAAAFEAFYADVRADDELHALRAQAFPRMTADGPC